MGLDFKDCNSDEFEKRMDEKIQTLKSKTLYKNVINDTVDKNNFEFLLKMMKNIYNKVKHQADKVVGKQFSDKYLQPLINNGTNNNNN